MLSRFGEDEAALLARVVASAADAVELIARSGAERAMNEVNGIDLAPPTQPKRPET